jgi:hypothetical protein
MSERVKPDCGVDVPEKRALTTAKEPLYIVGETLIS